MLTPCERTRGVRTCSICHLSSLQHCLSAPECYITFPRGAATEWPNDFSRFLRILKSADPQFASKPMRRRTSWAFSIRRHASSGIHQASAWWFHSVSLYGQGRRRERPVCVAPHSAAESCYPSIDSRPSTMLKPPSHHNPRARPVRQEYRRLNPRPSIIIPFVFIIKSYCLLQFPRSCRFQRQR